MGQKFYFFTDPALLNQQTPEQAYGPQPSANGKDIFQVTDIHTSTTPAPAFAICDGLVAAQLADNGTITLVLKPSQQPPFDFPFISYFIYKGIDPASLLAADGSVDTSQTTNELIYAIKKSWELPDNNNGTTKPSKNCLGLHLTPAEYLLAYPNDQNATRFADDQAMETLFYEGDPNVQLTPVKAGWKIGTFAASGFGFEIVLERLSYRPHIGLSRKFTNSIEVDALDSSVTYEPDDTPYFMHWHAKENCLNFIDPCAFWGGFVSAAIRLWDGVDNKFKKQTDGEIYEKILRGTTNAFSNRNKVYLDLRNEIGQSINYYKARGRLIQLSLDPEAIMDTILVDYYGSGWPLLVLDNPALPTGLSGSSAALRFAVPKDGQAETVLFACVGFGKKLRPLTDEERFPRTYRRADSEYLSETTSRVPLADDAGTNKLQSCYIKLYAFQRQNTAAAQLASSTGVNLAPEHTTLFDRMFPLASANTISSSFQNARLRTFDECFFVETSADLPSDIVVSPVIISDDQNIIFVLVPQFALNSGKGAQSNSSMQSWSAVPNYKNGESAVQLLMSRLPFQISKKVISDPDTNAIVTVLTDERRTVGSRSDNLIEPILFAMTQSDFLAMQTLIADFPQSIGSPVVGLVQNNTITNGAATYRTFDSRLILLAGVSKVLRQSVTSSIGFVQDVGI